MPETAGAVPEVEVVVEVEVSVVVVPEVAAGAVPEVADAAPEVAAGADVPDVDDAVEVVSVVVALVAFPDVSAVADFCWQAVTPIKQSPASVAVKIFLRISNSLIKNS